jgi:membrane-bound metal-dependent hydrolase YbcI (DUF457 family)
MLGKNHVRAGMLGSLAILTLGNIKLLDRFLPYQTVPVSKTDALFYVLIGGGSALIPDIDSAGSYIANSIPPITSMIAKFIGKVNRHRGVTHTVIFAAAIFLLCIHLNFTIQQALICYLTGMTLYVSIPSFFIINGFLQNIFKFQLAFLVIYGLIFYRIFNITLNRNLVALHISLGVLNHIAMDCLTMGGCRILWPFSNFHLSLSQMRVGGEVERRFVAPFFIILLVVCSIVFFARTY